MPDRDVKTVKDLIFYQYSKIIARSAFGLAGGKEAKAKCYGFIKTTFRELKSGKRSWSEITRENWQLVEAERACAYCGGTEHLHHEHLVPRSLRVKPDCESCAHLLGIDNQVLACRSCNLEKGAKGLYEYFHQRDPADPKFYDAIPPLIEKKYLKTIYLCHGCANTLDLDIPGSPTVLDIDSVLRATPSSKAP